MSEVNKEIIDISATISKAERDMKALYNKIGKEEAGKPEHFKPLQKAINRLAVMFDRTFFLKEWSRQVEERRTQELDKMLEDKKPKIV